MKLTACAVAAGLILAPAVRADLTLEYKTEMHTGPGVPAPVADAIKQQVGASPPSTSIIRIKGDKVFSAWDALISIIDYAKGQVTLLHPPTKSFATLPASEYAAQVSAAIPEEAREAIQNAKIDIKVEKTGRTGSVYGIAAEETVITMSLELPNPAFQQGALRLDLHNWMASAEALQRFPEFRQWNPGKLGDAAFDPVRILSSTLAQGPVGEKLRASLQEIAKNSSGLSLKTEIRVYLPMIARELAAQGVSGADGPLLESVIELDRYSADPVPDSVFDTPADYKPAPLSEIIARTNLNKLTAPH
jgi:hypothetical protein